MRLYTKLCFYEWIAFHTRNSKPFGYTTVEDHQASQHRVMSEWNPEKFIQRAAEVGPYTKVYIKGILNSRHHPEQDYKSFCQFMAHQRSEKAHFIA